MRGGFSETWHHHISLPPFSPAARYQNELAGVDTELLAERFYYQALSVAPQIGKWIPQLGPSNPAAFSKRKMVLRWQAGHAHFLQVVLVLGSFMLHLGSTFSLF